MKKILIFTHSMEIGGAERALLGLLNSFDYTKYSVDLFLMRHEGELMPFIPKKVNLISETPQYASLAIPLRNVLRKGQIGVALSRAFGKWKAQQYIKKNSFPCDNAVGLEYSHKYTRLFMPTISDVTYDLAISFLTPHYFVTEKVKANKKVAWIHTDYSVVTVDVESEIKMWDKYDCIASISNSVTEGFTKVFPMLSDKIVLIENISTPLLIYRDSCALNAKEEMPFDGSVRLLSIGRFCTAKNFDNIPDICSRIRDKGLNVKWYIIGYGGDEELIRRRIEEFRMQDSVILLGKKENPYPYIATCDLYVQPSRYEGKCVTVREAQILAKPVVITNYATSTSQLEDDVDGIIVPMDNEGCANGIAELLKNPEKMRKLGENCCVRDYSNDYEVEKIYQLME